MARQRILDVPATVDINGKKASYDIVRIGELRFRQLDQIFDRQIMDVTWAIGSIDNGRFIPAPYGELQGAKTYDNSPPDTLFGALLLKTLSLGIGPFLDQVFADLEADGVIGTGKQEDYGLAPGS
jgi:hypothetical protein